MADEKAMADRIDDVDPKVDPFSESNITWSEEEEKRVRNKLDWQIVPMVTVLYLMVSLEEITQ